MFEEGLLIRALAGQADSNTFLICMMKGHFNERYGLNYIIANSRQATNRLGGGGHPGYNHRLGERGIIVASMCINFLFVPFLSQD